jgi:hypothetical protein
MYTETTEEPSNQPQTLKAIAADDHTVGNVAGGPRRLSQQITIAPGPEPVHTHAIVPQMLIDLFSSAFPPALTPYSITISKY